MHGIGGCASSYPKVYAAQPREGTETGEGLWLMGHTLSQKVYAAQPREGTETLIEVYGQPDHTHSQVYAAQPREGTETAHGL